MNWNTVVKPIVDQINEDIDLHINHLIDTAPEQAVTQAKQLKQAWFDGDVERAEDLLTDPDGVPLVQAYFNIKLGFKVS